MVSVQPARRAARRGRSGGSRPRRRARPLRRGFGLGRQLPADVSSRWARKASPTAPRHKADPVAAMTVLLPAGGLRRSGAHARGICATLAAARTALILARSRRLSRARSLVSSLPNSHSSGGDAVAERRAAVAPQTRRPRPTTIVAVAATRRLENQRHASMRTSRVACTWSGERPHPDCPGGRAS